MNFRPASLNDCRLLAELNHQLIQDEDHRNAMTVAQLEERMRDWLAGEFQAVLFMERKETVAYGLYREEPEKIYLRHFFVVRHHRRQGVGRRAFEMLRHKIWSPNKRLTVEVLIDNQGAVAFWRAMGYQDYALTLEIMPVQPAK